MPRWERRFRAPTITMPGWAPSAPDRLWYEGTESGIWQVHTWDRVSGARRRVTDQPVGVITGNISPDGSRVLWWQDEDGDESGRWMSEPFEGGEAAPLLEGVPTGWDEGFAQTDGLIAASVSGAAGFSVYVAAGGAPAVQIGHSERWLRVAGSEGGYNPGGLSADGSMLCLQLGHMMHPSLRVVDPRTGETLAELRDEGRSLSAAAWSPAAGDGRLVVTHERGGEEAAAIWEPATGAWTDVASELVGPTEVFGWWPDATALLVRNEFEARHRLYRFDLASGELSRIAHPDGQISEAAVRPDGTVWFHHSSGATAPRILDDQGNDVLVPQGEEAPVGRPFVSFRFDNPQGQSVHGFYVTPEGSGPWPVLVRPHGGPTWLDEDRWHPEVQSYVDAGLAVAMINYRGSTGYGAEWRDALIGNIGGPEPEDLNAGLAHLASIGIADPNRAAIGGWSWGGYLTLLEVGKHPELWRCGVAGIPVGDYEVAYDQLSPSLQEYDRALLGGTPADVPELMRDRNPINFVDEVVAPLLFLIGEHDSRCPPAQAFAFADRLKARGHPHEVYVFGTGHGSYDIDEEVRQQRTILRFLAANLPGVSEPGAG